MRAKQQLQQNDSQSGFSLITAIFVLVITSSAAVVLYKMMGGQSEMLVSSGIGIQSSLAAESGLEWGINEAVVKGNCSASSSLSFSDNSLGEISVTVTCSAINETEMSNAVTLYEIQSTATYGSFGDDAYLYKQVSAVVEG